MNVPNRSVVLTIALVVGLLVWAGLAQADETAWKAAHDTDPHLPLTAQQVEMTAQKRAAEETSVSGFALAPIAAPDSTCGSACGGGGSYPSSASLTANQTPQA